VPVTGVDVLVASNGRLGVAMSSARFKHGIQHMGEASSKLLKLRPVIFRYNNDSTDTTQYGLVAEKDKDAKIEALTERLNAIERQIQRADRTQQTRNASFDPGSSR
jgi:hypothetical protein